MVEMMAASSPQFSIQKSIQDLVTHHLPASAGPDKVTSLVSYCTRLLSSRLATQPTPADADHLKQILHR